ncbi:exocyst complex component exo84 [Ceratobasidium sp. 392]|nr:exocyst complex component exo84 [Ceratobasidium sp. 392]
MKSLRTRRPGPPSAPQPRPQKQKLSKANKDARKSRVDDKMKRRMSARYADISDPHDAEVPDMPDLRDLRRIAGTGPTFYDDEEDEPLGGTGGGMGEEARVDVLDVRDLEQEDFDPDAYLKSKLGSSTEAELRNFQTSLQTTKDATALDLQKNVFKNYADFVIISKEISTLENDMLELKASLQEWKSMPSLLTLDQSALIGDASAAADRRRTARSSIADLRTLYVSQLQTLHSTIEGSATLRVRAIRFEGDARSYIKELALVVFTSIKHTADWYLASFKDIEMASGLVRWAKGQVEDFARMFCIQVYGAESNISEHAEAGDLAIAQECIYAAKTQNKRLLRDIGMDFNFLLLDLISLPLPPEERAAAAASQAVPELSLPEEFGSAEDTAPLSASKPPRPPRSPAPPPPRSRDRGREGSTGR